MTERNCDERRYGLFPPTFEMCAACVNHGGVHSNFVAASEGVPVETTAHSILYRAAEIMEERGKQYDAEGGERSMGRAVSAFNTIAGRDLQESEGWLLLQILKDVRDRQRKEAHTDSLEDCVAYAALKAEARLGGK